MAIVNYEGQQMQTSFDMEKTRADQTHNFDKFDRYPEKRIKTCI